MGFQVRRYGNKGFPRCGRSWGLSKVHTDAQLLRFSYLTPESSPGLCGRVERPYRFEVPGRVDYKGDVVQELNEDAVRKIAGQIREKGVKAVAICYYYF